MKKNVFTITGTVKQFPQAGGWIYLPIPQTYSDLGVEKPRWGLVPVTITIGNTTWRKSLLPFGDGSLFIALNATVRKAEEINVGDTISATFSLYSQK